MYLEKKKFKAGFIEKIRHYINVTYVINFDADEGAHRSAGVYIYVSKHLP